MVMLTRLDVKLYERTLRVLLIAAEALLPPTVNSRKPATSLKAPKGTSAPEGDKLHPHNFNKQSYRQAPLTGQYLYLECLMLSESEEQPMNGFFDRNHPLCFAIIQYIYFVNDTTYIGNQY